jgi:DNA-binding NtrC family response regulator
MIHALKKILLVDDEERLLNSMAQRLALLGIEATKVSSGTDAIEIVKKTKFDLAIVDLKMPDMDGLMTITKLKEISPELKTVLLTGYGSETIHQKTDSLDAEYFEKDSMGDLWDLIKQFTTTQGNMVVVKPVSPDLNQEQSQYLNDRIKQDIDPHSFGQNHDLLPRIIGETPEMQRLRKDVQRLSELDCTVLIQGETGTGKELFARTIHRRSHRRNQRFLAFNCGCFSNGFHFDELLGSLETATPGKIISTDASENRFVGTILLDHFEIMPIETQREMVKIIDKMAEIKSGDNESLARDIRFIVATHQDLKQRVDNDNFSLELYQKLNAIELTVPPLRERREDILPLCSYLLSQLNKEFQKNIEAISNSVFSRFMSYSFPGNIRELKHLIERAVIIADGTRIESAHLPERLTREEDHESISFENQPLLTLGEMERKHILKVLNITKGNKSKTAELLGISRAALWRKLKLINPG